jgi:hypothetical protein
LTPWDLFALLLIVLPLPAPENPPEELWDALVRVSLTLELADPVERWQRPHNFRGELSCLRYRLADFRDAPHSNDARRWDTAVWAAEGALAANAARLEHLQGYLDVAPDGARVWQVRTEVEWLEKSRNAWWAVASVGEAEKAFAPVLARRYALRRLLYLLGPEDYYAGALPCPVPLWLYQDAP